MHTESISSLFLDRLFLRPAVLYRMLYKAADTALFPSRQRFIAFLQAKDHQERYDLAREVLLAISYYHHIAPPSRLFLNLSAYEQKLGHTSAYSKKSSDFLPRDHFLHLANLYLLGVFLFSYHKGLHDECRHELRRYIPRDSSQLLRSQANPYATFSRFWAYFVLYHDLGYPLEKPAGHWTAEDKISTTYLPFGNIETFWLKDLALRGICRLVPCYYFLSHTRQNHPLSAYLRDAPGTTSSQVAQLSLWLQTLDAALHCRRHPTPDTLAIIRNWCGDHDAEFLEETAFMQEEASSRKSKGKTKKQNPAPASKVPSLKFAALAVLEHEASGRPLCVIRARNSPDDRCYFLISDSEKRRFGAKDEIQLYESAFVTGQPLAASCRWEYFLYNSPELWTNLARDLFGTDTKNWDAFLQQLSKNRRYHQDIENHEIVGMDEGFHVYLHCHRTLGYMGESDTPVSVEQRHAEDRQSVQPHRDDVSAVVIRSLSHLIDHWIKSSTPSIYDETKGGDAEAFLEKLRERLSTELKDDGFHERLKHRLAKESLQDLKPRTEERIAIRRLRDEVLNRLQPARLTLFPSDLFTEKNFSDGKYSPRDATASSAFKVLTKTGDSSLARISEQLSHEKEPYAKLMNAYKPAFPVWFDHGMLSALVALETTSIAQQYRDAVFPPNEPSWNASAKERTTSSTVRIFGSENHYRFGLAWYQLGGAFDKLEDASFVSDFELIRDKVAPAIFIHNLYPSELTDDKLKTLRISRRHAPLAFFACLADSLQGWDRSYLANPASAELSRRGFSPVSLQLVDRKIHIRIVVKDHRSTDAVHRLVESWSQYLDGVESMVKVEIA